MSFGCHRQPEAFQNRCSCDVTPLLLRRRHPRAELLRGQVSAARGTLPLLRRLQLRFQLLLRLRRLHSQKEQFDTFNMDITNYRNLAKTRRCMGRGWASIAAGRGDMHAMLCGARFRHVERVREKE